MGKVTWKEPPGPDDPIFREGPRSYNPHWGRAHLRSKAAAPVSPFPEYPHARQAPDGQWYIPDPERPGKYLRIVRQ